MAKLALCMIVKNETRVLERCFDSVRPFIDTWCISDTGSTDGTQALITEYWAKHGIPGKLIEDPWEREDLNRTRAVMEAGKLASHVLWIDADEVLRADAGFKMPAVFTHDIHEITVNYSAHEYARPQILSGGRPWYWKGRVHPELKCDELDTTITLLPGIKCIPEPSGSSWDDPDKFKKHAALLELDVKEDPTNPRLWYYLAQSYRDCENSLEARRCYMQRAEMHHGWVEETWSALYEAGKAAEKAELPASIVVSHYMDAWRYRPTRAESLFRLGRYLRLRSEWMAGALFLQKGLEIPFPTTDRLFVETHVYEWQLLDELILCHYYLGNKAEAQRLMTRMRYKNIPEDQKKRILIDNAGWVKRMR